jgi:hypothetical protein
MRKLWRRIGNRPTSRPDSRPDENKDAASVGAHILQFRSCVSLGRTDEIVQASPSAAKAQEQSPELKKLVQDPVRHGLRLLPLLPVKPADDASTYEVDLIAVHGLGGDYYETWRYKSPAGRGHDMFWPSQLLPYDAPGARIYSFGYGSGVAFSRSVASLRDSARSLLQHIMRIVDRVSLTIST